MAPRCPQAKLQRRLAEESLEAAAEAQERANQRIGATPSALAELCVAAKLGEDWMDVIPDEYKVLPADILLAIRAALTRSSGGGRKVQFQDAADVTIPKRVTTSNINKSRELASGDTFEALPQAAQGEHIVACTRKTADTIRSGVTIRGEEIRAQPKKKKDHNNRGDKDEPAAKEGSQKKNDGRKWFVGCYGCGEDHHWSARQLVGPLGQF